MDINDQNKPTDQRVAALPELRFEQGAVVRPHGLVAQASWWDTNQYRISSLLRAVSHGMMVTSGAGVGAQASGFRVAAGGIGLSAAGYMALFGEKTGTSLAAPNSPEPSHVKARPIGRVYYGLMTAAAGALVASGVKKNRMTETIAGLWTMVWSAYAAIAAEDAPVKKPETIAFDAGTGGAMLSQPYVQSATFHRAKQIYRNRPKTLAADMLQLSAAFVAVDALTHKDPARLVSAVCLGASNFIQRNMRDSDFVETASVGR